MNAEYWKNARTTRIPGGNVFPEEKFLNFVPRGGKILDIGCGNGSIDSYLVAHGYHVTGVDINKALIEQNREKSLSNTTFLVHDLHKELPFLDNEFDAIVSAFVLVNILPKSARISLLKELSRVLKPGGMIWIHEGIVSVKYVQRYALSSEFVEEENDFLSFRDKNTASRLKTKDDLKKIIDNGGVERTIHHFTKEEFDNLFSEYECISWKIDNLKARRGGNPLESVIATYKLIR